MVSVKSLVCLVAFVFAVFLIVNVSASTFAEITSIEVNGIEVAPNDDLDIAAFAGQTLPVRVFFDAFDDARDVRVRAWISGARDLSVSSERFDVLEGRTYSRLMSVTVPFDIDPDEFLTLFVSVESRNEGEADRAEINLAAQRESYIVEVLDINLDPVVQAGGQLTADVVLKNRGRRFAEDTFVRASIPALGIETRVFFEDLSPEDQSDPDKEDAEARRISLRIPSNAPAGIYVVEFEAFNADTSTSVSRKVNIVGASEDTTIMSGVSSRTFKVGEKGSYAITLVNSGDKVRVYRLEADAPTGLMVEIEEPVVAVPAGSSKTVKIEVSSTRAGRYNFAVNVNSDSETISTESFAANIQGTTAAGAAPNATLILTIVLAVIFVVLLVVLIVLLTRKTERKEEVTEGYY